MLYLEVKTICQPSAKLCVAHGCLGSGIEQKYVQRNNGIGAQQKLGMVLGNEFTFIELGRDNQEVKLAS